MAGNAVRDGVFPPTWLTRWQRSGTAVYVPDDGVNQRGCVRLEGGGYVEQLVHLGQDAAYTVAVAVKGTATAVVEVRMVEDLLVMYSESYTPTGAWVTRSGVVGLAAGQYWVRITAEGAGEVLLDEVSVAHIPATRQALARRAHDWLSDLATEFGLNYAPDADWSEGDYTFAVSDTLVELGMVDERGQPDVRALDEADVSVVARRVAEAMLPVLHNKAMLTPTSYRLGPLSEERNITAAIQTRMGIQPGQTKSKAGVIQTRPLRHGGRPV